MSVVSLHDTAASPRGHAAPLAVHYTICPVLVASNIAAEFGWLDEEFRRVGADPVYLRSLENNAGWLPHYRHSLNPLFRDGGAIPTIWARADLTDTTLIALTGTQSGGQIVVRADADVYRIEDLRGRRFGLPRSLAAERIDFARAAADYGATLALRSAGVDRAEVEFVDFEEPEELDFLQPARRPVELWSQLKGRGREDAEVRALAEGRIDAIYSALGRTVRLLADGRFKVIADLSQHPDWTLQVVNGPYTNAVNRDFAQAHPEVVVAFLRASIRAGRWINANRAAAAEIFPRVTFLPDAATAALAIGQRDFVPNLAPRNLAAIEAKKRFLLERGYVRNDFALSDWADAGFLQQALASLDR